MDRITCDVAPAMRALRASGIATFVAFPVAPATVELREACPLTGQPIYCTPAVPNLTLDGMAKAIKAYVVAHLFLAREGGLVIQATGGKGKSLTLSIMGA